MIFLIFSLLKVGVFLWLCIIIASCSLVKSQNSVIGYQNVTIQCGKSLAFPENRTELGNGVKWYHLSRENLQNELTSAVNQLSTFEVENVLNTSLLEILSVTIYDAGWYSCLKQSETTKEVIHSIWLDVHCDGYPKPFTNTWLENGIIVSSGLLWQIVLNISALKVPREYLHQVCNKNGCMKEKYTVKLTAQGNIELQEEKGKFIALFCGFNSESRWISEWYFYDDAGNQTKLEQKFHNLTETHTTHKISMITDDNEGEYVCKANSVDLKWETKHVFHLKVVQRMNPYLSTSSTSRSPKTNPSENDSLGNYDIIIFVTTSSLILLLIGIVSYSIIAYCRLKRKRKLEKTEMQQFIKKIIVEKQIHINGDIPDCLNIPIVSIQRIQSDIVKGGMVCNDEYEISIDERWEFPRNNLSLGNTLGEGEFGKVVRGEALNISGQENVTTTVAVKMVKDDHTDKDMIDLVSELELMKLIGHHPNILQLIGCCTQKGPLLVITEYAANGNLKNYLRRLRIESKNVPENTLMKYALQIAQGMEYFASIKCIHRDLAARNILVMADLTMKIADFGLSRNIRNKDYYKKTSAGRLPIKWMAPEAIRRHHYTTQSDVWSFGVLMWEIVTLGGNPYPTFDNMVELFHAILKNYRMEKPPNTSSNIYNLMSSCWKYEPEHRPNFSTIVEILSELSTNTDPKLKSENNEKQSSSFKSTLHDSNIELQIRDQSEHDEIISVASSEPCSENENDD
ncbi:fibroblast growth factor receptor 3-like isoform X2 [Planococcus citri]|uniref:fibroblast growth factor receptor 3-like isoform X2 n=1 Tax=Planococcus citri TaxID=170843 RepID=UPI0031F8E5EC